MSPSAGGCEAGDGFERGGLASAVGTNQRDQPPSRTSKLTPLDGLDAAVGDPPFSR